MPWASAVLVLMLARGARGDDPGARPAATAWVEAFPVGSAALGQWAAGHPDAAQRLLEWEQQHPLRCQFFLRWISIHPQGTLRQFMDAHGNDLPAVRLVLAPRSDAFEELVNWGHLFGEALGRLAESPGALQRDTGAVFASAIVPRLPAHGASGVETAP